MKFKPDFQSRFRILKGGKISLVVSALLGSVTLSFAAPTGGVVTSGNATISQNGTVTNINQSTQKATINWQNFSIKSNETVNFNQPNVNSITLNRVVGNERSVIDGALNANGQVWILNSNGILFNKNAKINTAGIVASTKNISDENFNAGNYTFSGNSTESVINMGTIEASDNGYVALLANSVQNDGTIKAYKGTVHLTGANEATINLNGNSIVSLSVNKGVLDALVENKGAILADGGKVYLTTNAVDELLKGVVNNTGIIEAKSLEDMNSEVILFAHGGTANISGTIDASGGFVETSGKELNIESATNIKASHWLIDPENITIESTGGGDVSGASIAANAIETYLSGTGSLTLQADNNINVNQAISWNSNTLTLNAGNNIFINQNLTATGTGALALYYGQGTQTGIGSNYSVANGVSIKIPNANGVSYKKGSDGTITYLSFNNGNIRTLNYNTAASFDANGLLLQPWYYNSDSSTWYKLTYSSNKILQGLAIGGDGTNTWNINGVLDDTPYSGNFSYEISKYNPNGYGEIEVTNTTTIDSKSVEIKNNYSLAQGERYLNVSTTITNKEIADSISNVRYWVGTNDDWVGGTDSPTKLKGNVDGNGFTPISNASEHSAALKLTDTGTDSVLLFYTGSDKAVTVLNSSYGAFLGQVMQLNPYSSAITNSSDGAYGLYVRFNDLAAGASDSFTWSYAAATSAQMESIQQAVSGNIPPAPTPTPTPSTTTDNKIDKVIDTIVNQQQIKVEPPKILVTQPSIMTPIFAPKSTFVLPTVAPTTQATTMLSSISQALGLKQGESVSLISTPNQAEATQKVTMGEIQVLMGSNNGETNTQNNGNAPMVETRVALGDGSIIDLVNGGVNLPEGVDQEFYVVKTKQASN